MKRSTIPTKNQESGIFADDFNDDIEWLIPTPDQITPTKRPRNRR